MRIAIFSDNFYPELSGISDSIIALARELAKKGHYVDFYVPYYKKEDFEAASVPSKEIDLGDHIQVTRFFSFPYKTGTGHGRFVIPTGLRALTVFKFHPDVIHTQLFFGVGFEAIIAARLLVKPVIGTNHTALKEYLNYSFIQQEWFKTGLLKYVNWYYERCELVTAPSQSVFDEMVSLGFKNVKSRVVSNPIDTVLFHPLSDRKALKKKFGFNDTTIIHAGRLAEERSPEVLVQALPYVKKEVPGAMLAFAGSGSSMNILKDLAKTLHVEDSVKFLGFISKPDLNEAYNASEVFAITSTSDTQSLVMMQAMAAGIPVVGVKARALPEYVNAGNGFIVPPNDPEKLAEKIAYILKNPTEGQKLGKGARQYSLQFSEPSIADTWEEIYKSVIKSYNERYHKPYSI
jgi:1,2-diacylglycerol 3-alpha-glucosyltransferase